MGDPGTFFDFFKANCQFIHCSWCFAVSGDIKCVCWHTTFTPEHHFICLWAAYECFCGCPREVWVRDGCSINLHWLWIFWRVLIDMLAPYRKGKSGRAQPRPSIETTSTRSSVDENEPQVVLPSSTELFYFYGQSLEQCAKLSTGKALFDLCALHKKWLRIYAGELEASSTSVLSFLHSLRY